MNRACSFSPWEVRVVSSIWTWSKSTAYPTGRKEECLKVKVDTFRLFGPSLDQILNLPLDLTTDDAFGMQKAPQGVLRLLTPFWAPASNPSVQQGSFKDFCYIVQTNPRDGLVPLKDLWYFVRDLSCQSTPVFSEKIQVKRSQRSTQVWPLFTFWSRIQC